MFIQLTRLDGRKIWFNTHYMVTVEQRKGPGAIVVPLGDDLDYEVRESPEKVVSLCDGTPIPDVVETPPPEPPKYKINLPFANTVEVVPPVDSPAAEAPQALTVPVEPPPAEDAAISEKPVEKSARKATAKKKTTTTKARGGRKPKLDLDEAQLTRLKSMKPGSEKKLVNTLNAQFGVADVAKTVKALVAHGHMDISDQGHIDWK